MHSQSYIIKFVLIMTTIVALVLALLSTGLKDIHNKNEAIYNKKAIVGALAQKIGLDMSKVSGNQIDEIFSSKIEQVAVTPQGKILSADEIKSAGYLAGRPEDIDMAQEIKKPADKRILPVYIYKADGKNYYVFNVRGKGLWDEIWGNIAFESDLNTIAGVAFDHKGETPGLGAEIKDNPAWKKQFEGKKIYDDSGKFVSVDVVKAGSNGSSHAVDGISGATITGVGVANMMESGLALYESYIKSQKK